MQKEENEIDLGLFFEVAEENKIMYNQVPVNTLTWKNGFFMNSYFTLSDEGEIDSNRFFKDSNELAKFIDKIFDEYDDHLSINYTYNVYRCFRTSKRVNRSEHGRGANEFSNILEYEGENCYLLSGNAFKRGFRMEYFELIQSFKRRTNVMTRCRIPELCERYKIDFGIYDLKSKRIVPWSVKQRDVCVYIPKNHYCVIWTKIRKVA